MAKSIPVPPVTKRPSRQVQITFIEDLTTPAHYPTYDVQVTENGREIEAGDLTGMQAATWLTLIQKYLEHRLCPTCPGSTSAKPLATTTRANPPGARGKSSR